MNRTQGMKFNYETRKWMKRKIPCIQCGTPTMSAGTTATCEQCKLDNKRRREQRCENDRMRDYDYIVVNDPDKEYGYSTGAIFTSTEVALMCQTDIRAFTYGTILKHKDKLYRVELYSPTRRLKLIEIKD